MCHPCWKLGQSAWENIIWGGTGGRWCFPSDHMERTWGENAFQSTFHGTYAHFPVQVAGWNILGFYIRWDKINIDPFCSILLLSHFRWQIHVCYSSKNYTRRPCISRLVKSEQFVTLKPDEKRLKADKARAKAEYLPEPEKVGPKAKK